MTIKKRLMGCIEIDDLVYPENFSLQELLPLSEEAQQLTTRYAHDIANLKICIFHLDALINYCMIPNEKRSLLLNIKIGGSAKVYGTDTFYEVYRLSEHFYEARILETIPLYVEEEPITVKQDVKERVYIPERQNVKEEAKKERIRIYN